MLCALLLTLLVQDPPVQVEWPDPDTSQDYYAALHLLEVEDDPAAAARALRELWNAYEGETRMHEARALLLAQLHRAQVLSGESAEPWIRPQAESLARGTEVEAAVGELLSGATAPAAHELDMNFLKLVFEQLGGEDYEGVTRYGRQIIPYLISILDPNDLRLQMELGRSGGEAEARATERAFQIGAQISNREFARFLLDWARTDGDELRRWADKSLHHSLATPQDELAAETFDWFLLNATECEDLATAAWAASIMCTQLQLRESPELERRIIELLTTPENPIGPAILSLIPVNHRDWRGTEGLRIWEAAARSPNQSIARAARNRLMRYQDKTVLLELAAESEDPDDDLRLAWTLLESSQPLTQERRIAVRNRLGGEGADFRGYDPKFHGLQVRPFLESADEDLRVVAAAVAASQKDEALLRIAARNEDLEVRRAIVRGGAKELGPEFDEFLLTMLGDDDQEVRRKAARALERGGERLTHEQLVMVERALPAGEWFQSGVFERILAEDAEDGIRGLKAWISDERARKQSRSLASQALLRAHPEEGPFVLELLEQGAWDHKFSWGDHPYQFLLNYWLPHKVTSIAIEGVVEPPDRAQLASLVAISSEDARRTGNLINPLQQLFDSKPDGSAELMLEMIRDTQDLTWLEKQRSWGRGTAWKARVLAELVERFSLTRMAGWLSEEPVTRENVGILVPVLLGSGNDALVERAWNGLEKYGSGLVPELEGELAAMLADPRHASRAAYVLALHHPEAERFVPAMIAAWDLPGVVFPEMLLRAYGMTLDERTVPILLEAIASPNTGMASDATQALERMKRVRQQRQAWEAWQLLGGQGDSPVAALIKKLGSDKLEVRVAAIRSLGTLEAKEALPLLVDLLEDENASIRTAAEEALATING